MRKIFKNNVTLLNSVTSILLQFVSILNGFIIPKLILNTFGSEVNGLVSSLNQFLNYIMLLEGGVTAVIMANLYKPLADRNMKQLSSVVKTAQRFFTRIGIIFVAYTLIVALGYPLITHSSFSYGYIFSLTLILAVRLFVQYNFSLSLRTLLVADKKGYIVSLTQIALILLDIILFAILIVFYPNIHFLKLVVAIVFLLQPIIFSRFVKKYYVLDKDAEIDQNLLKGRWDGFAINIAAFIHYNTDVSVLTVFTDLKTVSIYSVYALVTNGLRQFIVAFSSGITPAIGNIYVSGDNDNLNDKFDIYEYVIFMTTFFAFSVAALLITPFVMIYTKNVTDTNYYQPVLGWLLILSEAFFCLKEPYISLAYSANKFKDIKKHAYIEAIINISLSIILVKLIGVVGVAIGTVVAMIYRTLFHVFYLSKNILNRPVWKFMQKLIIYSFGCLIGFTLCKAIIPVVNYTIKSWVFSAIVYSFIMMLIYSLISICFYKKEVEFLKKKIIKKY